MGAGPIVTADFNGFVFGLKIEVDGAVGLNGYAVMDGGAGDAGSLKDVVMMTEDVSEPGWGWNWEGLVGGLLEDPATEFFGVDGSG